MIRKATIDDVKTIHRLLREFADRGELLPRSLSDLYDHLRDFSVYEDKGSGCLVGVCALHVCWEDLAEIRSMVVDRHYQGRGIGSEMIAQAFAEAKDLGIKKIFTLTYQTAFFAKYGFRVVDKASLPQKVWAECVKCVKFPDCDETAMVRSLFDEEAT